MSSVEWDFKISDREIGPFTTQQVAEMARNGQLRPDDPVRKGTDGAWVPASQVRGLAFAATTSTKPATSTLSASWESDHRPDAIPLPTPFTATSEPGAGGQTVIAQPADAPFASDGVRHKARPSVAATTRVRSARRRRNIAFLISAGTACGAIIVAFTVFIALNASNTPERSPKVRGDSTPSPTVTGVKPAKDTDYLYLDNEHPNAANEDSAEVVKTPTQATGKEVDRPVANAPSKPSPPAVEPIPPKPILYMTFDEGTISQRGGKLLVKDLSPAGNDGTGEGVETVPNGIKGGALAIKGGHLRLPRVLLNKRSEYTIAFWVFREDSDNIAYEEYTDHDDVLYCFTASTFINAWNKNTSPLNWKGGMATSEPMPIGLWSFVACVFKTDDDFRGKAQVFLDDRLFEMETHTVDNDFPGYGQVRGKSSRIDELLIYDRALSDTEIRGLYERGRGMQLVGSK